MVTLVLVQQGKGATMGAAFGSGASQTVFGSRGSGSFLFRITMALMFFFFITSLTLNNLATRAVKQPATVLTFPVSPAKQIPSNQTSDQIPNTNNNDQALSSPSSPVTPDKIPARGVN